MRQDKSLFRQPIGEVLGSLIGGWIMSLTGPFNSLSHPAVRLYTKYKEEEKLALFFLTFGGILALVTGFAFTLQYSFSHLLNESAKVGLGVAVSIGIIAFGSQISLTKSTMQEYGASLIGLGITLTYLSLYFMTAYYGMVTPALGFALLAVNTIGGYALAYRFETRIVASISFVGGVFTPLFLGGDSSSTVFYALYLLLLSTSALHLAKQIKWTSLPLTSFIIVITVLEYLIFTAETGGTNNLIFILIAHAFFYLYIYFSLFSGRALLDSLSKQQILIVVGSAIFLPGTLYGLVETYQTLGLIYLVNALPFVALIFLAKLAITANQRAIMLLLTGSFIGLAIPSLFDMDIAGLFWALEGILLLRLGFQFESPLIRREGYLVIAFSMAEMAWIILPLGLQWDQGLLNVSYLNLLSIGFVLWMIGITVKRHAQMCDSYDSQIGKLSAELFSLWLAVTFFITTYVIANPYHLLPGVIPLFYFLYYGHKRNSRFTQYLGFTHYGLILLQIFLSIDETQSIRFIHQTLAGKISLTEAFFLLAGLQLFYEKFAPESGWLHYAKKLRIAFFVLLPLVVLPTVFRREIDLFPIALWASFIASYAIATWNMHPLLRKESLLLYAGAATYSVAYAYMDAPRALFSLASIGLYVGPFVGLFIVLRENGLTKHGFKNSWFAPIVTEWFIHAGIVAAAIISIVIGRFDVPLVALGMCFIYLALQAPGYPALRGVLRPIYYSGFWLLTLVIISHAFDQPYHAGVWIGVLLNIVALAVLFVSAINVGKEHRLIMSSNIEHRYKKKRMELWTAHASTVIVYTSALYLVTGEWLGPALTIALVVHATVILFVSLNDAYKSTMHISTILFGVTLLKIFASDLEGFSMLQKTLAFMVIGVILLAAAYKFQQYRNTHLLEQAAL